MINLAQRIKSEPFEVDLVNVQDATVGFSGLMRRDAADIGARLTARCKEKGDQLFWPRRRNGCERRV